MSKERSTEEVMSEVMSVNPGVPCSGAPAPGFGQPGFAAPSVGAMPSDEDDHNVAKAIKSLPNPFEGSGSIVSEKETLRLSQQPMVNVEVTSHNSCTYEILNLPNEQAARIAQDVLPKVLELYLNKSKDYGGDGNDLIHLGPKATFVDIWRKTHKLKKSMWDGVPMVGEQNDEILADLAGQVLLALDRLNQAR